MKGTHVFRGDGLPRRKPTPYLPQLCLGDMRATLLQHTVTMDVLNDHDQFQRHREVHLLEKFTIQRSSLRYKHLKV